MKSALMTGKQMEIEMPLTITKFVNMMEVIDAELLEHRIAQIQVILNAVAEVSTVSTHLQAVSFVSMGPVVIQQIAYNLMLLFNLQLMYVP